MPSSMILLKQIIMSFTWWWKKMYRVCFYKNFHLEQFLPYRSSGILISQKKTQCELLLVILGIDVIKMFVNHVLLIGTIVSFTTYVWWLLWTMNLSFCLSHYAVQT